MHDRPPPSMPPGTPARILAATPVGGTFYLRDAYLKDFRAIANQMKFPISVYRLRRRGVWLNQVKRVQ